MLMNDWSYNAIAATDASADDRGDGDGDGDLQPQW